MLMIIVHLHAVSFKVQFKSNSLYCFEVSSIDCFALSRCEMIFPVSHCPFVKKVLILPLSCVCYHAVNGSGLSNLLDIVLIKRMTYIKSAIVFTLAFKSFFISSYLRKRTLGSSLWAHHSGTWSHQDPNDTSPYSTNSSQERSNFTSSSRLP